MDSGELAALSFLIPCTDVPMPMMLINHISIDTLKHETIVGLLPRSIQFLNILFYHRSSSFLSSFLLFFRFMDKRATFGAVYVQ